MLVFVRAMKGLYVPVFQLSWLPVTQSFEISVKERHVIGTVKIKYDIKSSKCSEWDAERREGSF